MIAAVVLIAALTLAAVGLDLATTEYSRPARALYNGPFVRVHDTLVAYRHWGTSGSPIVLVGGAAEPSWVWHRVGPLLAADHHRVYALDLPPFGYTQRKGPYTLAGWSALIQAFDRRLGIFRPLIVGHSLGAGVAGATALAEPAGVRGVVFLDGDGLPVGHGIGWLSNLLVYPYYPALYRVLTGSDWVVSKVLATAWGHHRPKLTHALISVFERPFRVTGTAGALKQLAARGVPGLTLPDLRRLRVPRAVVWGQDDNVDSLTSGKATASAMHVSVTTIPGAGHLAAIERADLHAARR